MHEIEVTGWSTVNLFSLAFAANAKYLNILMKHP